jgi:hypothetical protein
MSGTINVGGMAIGMLSGSKIIGPVTILGSIPECSIVTVVLGSGDNTIPVPANAVAFMFVPGAGLAGIKYRSLFGDTGSYISPLNATVISFDAANIPSNIYLNVATPASGVVSEITFI